jgi:catechol 2,3-dioxygenase-like lactoylglutathione lyase family enzyme
MTIESATTSESTALVPTHGIYHMAVAVSDMDRALEFYTKVLGMQVDNAHGGIGKDDMGFDLRRASLLSGEDQVVLFQRPRPSDADAIAEFGAMHPAFKVDHETFENAVQKLADWGVKVYDLPVMERNSGRSFYFFDTEGNLLQLWTPPTAGATA